MDILCCPECGSEIQHNSVYCTKCGHNIGQPFQNVQNAHNHIYPPYYKQTKSPQERIYRFLNLDNHILEEIKERKDLQKEAYGLYILTSIIIAISTLLEDYFRNEGFTDYGLPMFLGYIEFNVFFIVGIIIFGKSFTPNNELSIKDMMRVYSYPFTIVIFWYLPNLLDVMLNIPLMFVFTLIAFFIYYIGISVTLHWVVERKLYLSILTFVISYFMMVLIGSILSSIVF